jgi:hypothetical protein
MSSMTSSSSVSSRIDEQLRLRIADELAGAFKGEIIGPDHAGYERSRQLWNAMADRRPGLILRCTSTQDVVAAVGVAREHGLPPAVRCGGHNVAGKAMSDGGLTIDLSGLREVSVDPGRTLVHAGGGCPPATRTTSPAPGRSPPPWPPGSARASTSTCSTSTSRTASWKPSAARRNTPGWPASRPGTTRRTCSA